MKRKLLTVLLLCTMTMSLVACGSSSDTTNEATITDSEATSEETTEPNEPNEPNEAKEVETNELLEIEFVEYGYSYSDGYVHYAFTITNPSDDIIYQYPIVDITARTADDSLVGVSTQIFSYLLPGDSVSYGAPFDVTSEPSEVEFSVSSGREATFIPDEHNVPNSALIVSNTTETVGSYESTKYIGEVENTSEYDQNVLLVVILKNGGEIVYGTLSYLDNIGAGQKRAFDILEFDVPAHDEYVISPYIIY
ncbi:MAG: hypothetical protein ACK5LL_10205 [Suipraeoptans sp.]